MRLCKINYIPLHNELGGTYLVKFAWTWKPINFIYMLMVMIWAKTCCCALLELNNIAMQLELNSDLIQDHTSELEPIVVSYT
jgi:hypothetical protein